MVEKKHTSQSIIQEVAASLDGAYRHRTGDMGKKRWARFGAEEGSSKGVPGPYRRPVTAEGERCAVFVTGPISFPVLQGRHIAPTLS